MIQAMDNKAQRHVNWAHFGGCIDPHLFNPETLGSVVSGGASMPVSYATVYRRGIAFVTKEWKHLDAIRQQASQLPEHERAEIETFLQAWCPEPKVLNEASVIFTNVNLDNLNRTQPRVTSDITDPRTARIPFHRTISNFPLETPGFLLDKFVVSSTSDEDILESWKTFLAQVHAPLIVCLLFATRNQMPGSYTKEIYRSLSALQEGARKILDGRSNALALEVDALIDHTSPTLYRDHHHLSEAGESALRQALLRLMDQMGLFNKIQAREGDVSLPFSSFPDRADFVYISDNMMRFFGHFYARPLLIGPKWQTDAIAGVLAQAGAVSLATDSLSKMPDDPDIDGVIYLKWTQHTTPVQWIDIIRKKYPSAYIECLSHWWKEHLLTADEIAFVERLRADVSGSIDLLLPLFSHKDRSFRRYLARMFGNDIFRSHRFQAFDLRAATLRTNSTMESVTPFVADTYLKWKQVRKSNVFYYNKGAI